MKQTSSLGIATRASLSAVLAVGVMLAGVATAGASSTATRTSGSSVALTKTHGHQPSRVDGVITATSSTLITVTNHKTSTQFTVDSTTAVTERKMLVPATDLVQGARVQVTASTTTPGTTPVTAASIVILRVPPLKQGHGFTGVVIAPAPTAPGTVTITSGNSNKNFTVTTSTLVLMRGFAAPLSVVVVGARVRILPLKATPGTAAIIEVFSNASASKNFVSGVVTLADPSSITIQNASGTTLFTIDATTLFVKGRLVILPANVVVGSRVRILASTPLTTPPTAVVVALTSKSGAIS
ncbi:MAG TPA: hypothetical protein VMV53_09365 [Acidimicrobiales bacterium]|nr:hypothetical protein [Acidimicrobiales bacterium]